MQGGAPGRPCLVDIPHPRLDILGPGFLTQQTLGIEVATCCQRFHVTGGLRLAAGAGEPSGRPAGPRPLAFISA
jgi:hypothetical protein